MGCFAGPASGSNRSTSGGGFTSGETHCRVANRSAANPSNANNNLYPMNITFEYTTKETYTFL